MENNNNNQPQQPAQGNNPVQNNSVNNNANNPAQANPTQTPQAPAQNALNNQPQQPAQGNNQQPAQANQVNPQQPKQAPGVPASSVKNMPSNPSVPRSILKKKKHRKGPHLGMGCLVFAVIFFILGILALVGIVISGGSQSTLFGISGASLVNTLKAVTTTFFLLLSIILLVITVILGFKRTVIPVAEKEARKKSLRSILIASGLFVFSIVVWLFVYLLLSQINVSSGPAILIRTEPKVVTQLTGPVEIEFDTSLIAQRAKNRGLTIAACEWDFNGDGRVDDSGCALSHNYDEIGVFDVILNVDYLRGGVRVDEKEAFGITVTIENLRPEINVTAEPSTGRAPLVVNFDASNSSDPDDPDNNIKFEWRFTENDRYSPGSETATHTYEDLGAYEAAVKVTDNKGAVSEEIIPIQVIESEDTEIVAAINTTPSEKTGVVPFQIRFDANQSHSSYGNITKYRWDLGDGSPEKRGASVSYIYRNGGEYNITLYIEDEKGNKAQDEVVIKVDNPAIVPQAEITVDKPVEQKANQKYIQGTVPFTVRFSGEDSIDGDNNITDYLWDLNGDGLYDDAQGDTVEWTYEEEGIYNASLQVIDADNQSTEAYLEVHVGEDTVRPALTTEPTPATGPAPLTVAFDASASEYEDGDIVAYEWDFDDGTQPILGDAQITHIFNLIGDYDVELTIYTDDNKEASLVRRVVVRAVPLKAKIEPSIKFGPAPLTVKFDSAESTGSIQKYSWTFGDGDKSTQAAPTHTFEEPGNYDVTLMITDNSNNIAKTTETIIVETP